MNDKIVKKTQDSLGKIIKKPPLTEKLLNKPPFRFLHDILTAVIKTSGTMKGLFTDAEMSSENVKDKDSKIAFLQKAIDYVGLVIGRSLDVRPSKIVAGHEPERTNEFLQALADAVNKNVNNEDYVKKALKGEKPKPRSATKSSDREKDSRESSANKDRKKEERKGSAGSRSKDRESSRDREKEKSRSEKDRGDRHRERSKDRSRDKVRDSNKENEEDEKRDRDREDRKDRDREGRKDREKDEKKEREDRKEKEREERKDRRDREKKSEKEDENKDLDEVDNVMNGQKDEEDHHQRIPRPSSAKGSRRRHRDDEEDARQDKKKDDLPNGIGGDEELPPQVAAGRRMARPGSAKPPPPRIKKQEAVTEDPTLRIGSGKQTANVIVDDGHNSDDDDTFVVEESAPAPVELDQPTESQTEIDENADHGGLVKKILESKKELEGGSQTAQAKSMKRDEKPLISDASRRKEREMVQKEIEKLRGSIQTLTRSANPLGKIMDYVQEDLDSMQKELEVWKKENKQHALALKREQGITESSIEPLKAQLTELDQQIIDQLSQIAAVKSNISRNDEKIEKMLGSVARH